MSRVAPGRRSGDPRKRTAVPPPSTARGRARAVVAAAAVAAAVGLGLAYPTLRSGAGDGAVAAPTEAEAHGAAACELTARAAEAADVDNRARYAAAVLLLDQAITESGRAAGSDPALADLDRAVQAVHTAGHRGDPQRLRAAFEEALAACAADLGPADRSDGAAVGAGLDPR